MSHLDKDIQPIVEEEDEKNVYEYEKGDALEQVNVLGVEEDVHAVKGVEIAYNEAERLQGHLDSITMEQTVRIVSQLVELHRYDPNFSGEMLRTMIDFLADPSIAENPDKHPEIVQAVKVEAILSTTNSPYAEVRANVDPTDDPTMPVSTIRAWIIGIVFTAAGSFIDTLFAYRNPSISIGTNVAQLVAYPLGCFLARVLPDWRIKFMGQEHSLNPGPFNRKEHMLISIMANVSFTAPYAFYIVPVQAMPQYFNMSFAYNRGYQLLVSLSTCLFGYGMAGLLRRFLVYPSLAIWPASLSTVALIKSFHDGTNEAVPGPFGRIYRASREKIFLLGTLGMFLYYFFPGYLFTALSSFSWITWIAPDNIKLDAITGIYGGLGINPVSTFDWNLFTSLGYSGLSTPTFALVNQFFGVLVGAFIIMAMWFSNVWNTAYLPINSNRTYDNHGLRYNVTAVLDSRGNLDETLYRAYSTPWFSAGYIVYNIFNFASYTAAFTYTYMFHRHDIARGFRGMWRSFRKHDDEDELEEDIHYRLMQAYKECPEWWYLVLLIAPIGFGVGAIAGFPTGAPVAALFYGLIMPVIFIIPIGIIQAVTGIPIALNVLAAIVGGVINAGHPNGLIFFKCWAYLSSWQALAFCNDMKLAHYLKIPPRVTFSAQIVATVILSVVSSLSYNFIMGLKDVCTNDAVFNFTCPAQTSFYTTTIFWGVISPKKLFGPGHTYNWMLIGFPLGVVVALGYWALRTTFPQSGFVRLMHPVMFLSGPVSYSAPYNMAYLLGNVYVNLVSFQYVRKRYLEFWSKWNYVINAAFSCGIALAALVIFFALQVPKGGTIAVTWWGNTVTGLGCEGSAGCPLLEVPEVGYFGPAPGTFA